MDETNCVKYLRIALLLVGVIFIIGIYPLTIIWPSGWSWHTGQSDYLQNHPGPLRDAWGISVDCFPQAARTLEIIWFTVWSSMVHGGIMAAQSLANSEHMGHLCDDVLASFVVGAVLALLTPRGATAELA